MESICNRRGGIIIILIGVLIIIIPYIFTEPTTSGKLMILAYAQKGVEYSPRIIERQIIYHKVYDSEGKLTRNKSINYAYFVTLGVIFIVSGLGVVLTARDKAAQENM